MICYVELGTCLPSFFPQFLMNKASAAGAMVNPLCKIIQARKSSKRMRIINIWNHSSLKIQIVTNGLTATGDDTEGARSLALSLTTGLLNWPIGKSQTRKKKKKRKMFI